MGEFFVYGAFFGLLFLFLPVFVYVDIYLDVRGPKAWFSVSLYKYLRVFGGYVELRKEGIAFHLTKKFAILVKYADMGTTRKKFEITKGFQLWRFHQTIETGGAESPYAVLLAAAIQSVGGATFSVLRTKHPFLSLKNSTVLADRPCLKLTTQTATVFNLLILLVAISKKILEALINWIRKKKSTASWKRQRSSS